MLTPERFAEIRYWLARTRSADWRVEIARDLFAEVERLRALARDVVACEDDADDIRESDLAHAIRRLREQVSP